MTYCTMMGMMPWQLRQSRCLLLTQALCNAGTGRGAHRVASGAGNGVKTIVIIRFPTSNGPTLLFVPRQFVQSMYTSRALHLLCRFLRCSWRLACFSVQWPGLSHWLASSPDQDLTTFETAIDMNEASLPWLTYSLVIILVLMERR